MIINGYKWIEAIRVVGVNDNPVDIINLTDEQAV